MDVQFREYSSSDREILMSIEKENMNQYPGWRKHNQNEVWDRVFSQQNRITLELNSEIIGFIVFEIVGNNLELNNIQIKKELQSRKLGTQVLVYIESILASRYSIQTIGLQVFKENKAKGLYERNGYIIMGEGGEENSYRMVKILKK